MVDTWGKGLLCVPLCMFCKLGIFLSLQVNKKGKSSQSYLIKDFHWGSAAGNPKRCIISINEAEALGYSLSVSLVVSQFLLHCGCLDTRPAKGGAHNVHILSSSTIHTKTEAFLKHWPCSHDPTLMG